MRILVLVVLLATVGADAAFAKDHAPPFKAVEGAFFALSVPNLAESVQWYSEKLGLSVVFQARQDVSVTVLEGGGLLVELIHSPMARPLSELCPAATGPDRVHGVFKAGFLVKDFQGTVDELRARGVAIALGPFPAQGNQKANVLIRDNAGNLIQIFGY